MIYLSTYPSICFLWFIFRHRFILFGLRLTCQASLFNLVMINFDIEQQSRCDWIYVCGCFARTCLSNGLLASLGGVGPRLGLSAERVIIIFARCCQIQNLSYGTSLHRHPLFLFSMILMSLIESDYDLYDFDDSWSSWSCTILIWQNLESEICWCSDSNLSVRKCLARIWPSIELLTTQGCGIGGSHRHHHHHPKQCKVLPWSRFISYYMLTNNEYHLLTQIHEMLTMTSRTNQLPQVGPTQIHETLTMTSRTNELAQELADNHD